MNLNRLRYFRALADAGSFARAAELLSISQPALSKAVKTLETELGIKLTVPSGRGVVITNEGRRLAHQIDPLLSAIAQMKQGDFLIEKERRTMKLGSFEVFTTHLMGHLVEEYFPDLRIDLYELTPGLVEDAVATERIDAGITYLPIPRADLDFIKITEFQMAIYAKSGRFQKSKFSELPFVVPIQPMAGSPSGTGMDGWPDHEAPRKVVFRVSLMETALEFCRRGMAVVYLPKPVVSLHNATVHPSNRLVELNPANIKTKRTKKAVYLIKRKAAREDSQFRRLARALRNISASYQ